MAAKIGVKIALDGEREFKQSLKACKDEVKLYRDELKELDEKFKTGKATLEDYRAKVDTLKEKQKALTDQLDAAKRGLQNANEQYDKQKTKLDDLETEYKEAKEALEKLKDESGEGTEAFRKQQEKVDALKEAVNKQTEVVNTSKTRTNQWTAEIRNSEKALKDCDKELDNAETELKEAGEAADGSGNKFEDFAGDVKKAGDNTDTLSVSLKDMVKNKVVDMAGDLLQNLGQKAIDAAKYIVQVGSDFEAQMSKVAAISGSTAEDTAKLTEKAAEMGRTTKFTATEAGQGLEYMAMAGWKTDDMLSGLDGIMALAAASGEDLGTTSDIVTDALTAFGESAGESGRLADIMATASSNANTNVSMMGETFKYAAPVAGALGYSMEDTAVAIGLMANAGIKASQAGTSLRGGLVNLVRPVGAAADAVDQYGISITDTDGKMLSFHDLMVQLREKLGGLSESEQAAAVSALFGKNAMSGWLAVVNASDDDFDKLTKAVDNSAGSAERMAEQMNDNLQGKLTLLNSAIEGFGVALYNYFSGPLQDVVKLATDFINGLTGLITPHKTELESFIDGIELSNKEVEKSIEHAKSTVSNAESRVAELEVYKQDITEVLTKCDNFNKIDLGDGKYQIVDATGKVVEEGFEPLGESATSTEDIIKKFGSDGFETKKIKEDSEAAADYVGYVSTEVDDVESRLKNFASDGIDTTKVSEGKEAIVQIFDNAGEEIGKFTQKVQSSGDVEITQTGIKTGTAAIVKLYNDAGEVVDTFETNVGESGNVEITTEGVAEGTTAIVECYTDAGKKIGEFKNDVEESGNVTVQTNGIEVGTGLIVSLYNEAGEKIGDFETRVGESGNIEINTQGVADGTTVIGECYTETGEYIDTFEEKVKGSGSAQINVTGVETGTTAMITAYNNATGAVESFRGKVEESGQAFDTTGVTDSFTRVEDSIKTTTYTITDEFTKSKINAMIADLGGAVDGLADAWNAETGELSASKEEMEDWFDTAKEVAMYKALEDSINELYSAWGEAAVNVAKANSATKQAEEAYKQAHQELQDFIGEHENLAKTGPQLTFLGKAVDETSQRYLDLMAAEGEALTACEEARDTQEKANATLEEANTELKTNSDTLTELKNIMGEATGANQDNRKSVEEVTAALDAQADSADDSAGNIEDLAEEADALTVALGELTDKQRESIEAYKDFFNVTDEGIIQLHDDLQMSTKDFADWCKKQAKAAEDLQGDFDKLVEKIHTSIENYLSDLDAADESGNKSLDNMIRNMQEHQEDVRQWGESMKLLAKHIGGDFTQEMYDELAAQGFEKSKETVAMLVQGIDQETGQLSEEARVAAQTFADGLNDEGILAQEIASFTSTGKELERAKAQGYVDEKAHFNVIVSDATKEAAQTAKNATSEFKEAGQSAGQEEAQGLKNEELGVKQASEAVVNAAKSAAETATQNFERVGEVSMTYLTRGMSNRSAYPSDKVKEIINSAKQEADTKASDFQSTGQSIVNYLANGISQNSGYYSSLWNAISTAVNNAKSAVDNAAQQMSGAGQSMMNALANGIRQYGYLAWNAGDSVGNQARSSLNWHINTFEGAGQEMDYGLAQGLVDKASYVSETAANVAYNAYISARNVLGIRSPSKEFEKIGAYSDEGMAVGFNKNQALVEDAARESARSAMEAAQDELSGSDYYTDLTGKISYAGAEQLNRITNAKVETADTASAMRSLTSGMSALREFAESLQNPQSPNVTVMIGGKEFKGYIVKTATEGMSQARQNIMKGAGAWA